MRLEVTIQGMPFALEANGFSPIAYNEYTDCDYFSDSVTYREFYATAEGTTTMPREVYEIVTRLLYTWHCQALEREESNQFRAAYPSTRSFAEDLSITDVLHASWTVYVMWLVQHKPAAEKKREDQLKTGQ